MAAIKAVAESANQVTLDHVLEYTLDCHPEVIPKAKSLAAEENYRGQYMALPQAVKASVRAKIKAKPLADLRKEDGSQVTAEDLVKIDLYTRVLSGELASAAKCSDVEVKALGRLILNRTQAIEEGRKVHKNFGDQPGEAPWLAVAASPKQFQALDGINEPAVCPSKDIQTVLGTGGSTGMKAYINLTRAIPVAMEMVLEPTKFARETARINNYFYTKGPVTRADWLQKGFTLIKNQRVFTHGSDGRPKLELVGNGECMDLWSASDLPPLFEDPTK